MINRQTLIGDMPKFSLGVGVECGLVNDLISIQNFKKLKKRKIYSN